MLFRDRSGRVLGETANQTIVPIYKTIISGTVANVDISETDVDWTYWSSLIFDVRRLTVDTDDRDIYLRVYDTTLAAWQSGATDYDWVVLRNNATAPTGGHSGGSAQIDLTGTSPGTHGVGSAANEAFSATIEIQNPDDTVEAKPIIWRARWIDSTNTIASAIGDGIYSGALNAISGFRFLPETGNFDGGEITVYGVRGP